MSKKYTSGSVLSLALTLALAPTAIPFSVQAADKYWSYTDCGTNWWDYNCWSATFGGVLDGNGQPLDGDDVYLYNADIANIQISYWNTVYPDATLNSLTINATGSGSMTLYQSANNLQTLNETVGDTGTGEVVQSGGTHSVTSNLILGNIATGNGSFSVSFGGILSAGDLIVGNDGTGILNISTGGSVTSTIGSYIGLNANSTGTVTVNGSGASLTADSIWTGTNWVGDGLTVGYDGNGILNIENGGSVTSKLVSIIGRNVNSTGAVTVTGTDSIWSADSLTVGYDGTGALNIENGGTVSSGGTLGRNVGSQGTVTVSGAGSSYGHVSISLIVGSSGTGILNINSGGLVSSSAGYLGAQDTGYGTAIVTGTGSNWTNSQNLYVGSNDDLNDLVEAGTGALNIMDGGIVTNVTGYVNSTGTVMVSGTGSSWINSNDLYIGVYGTGDMSINNGGSVSSYDGFLGSQDTGHGTATVTGTGASWINSDDLYIGSGGIGILNIDNGGLVSSTKTSLGHWDTGNGVVTVNNATLANSDSLSVGTDGTGALSILNGGNVSNQDGYIGAGYRSTSCGFGCVNTDFYYGDGTVTVDGAGSTWVNNGYLRLYNGTLSILNGGSVSSENGVIGDEFSTASVTVDGIGSTWMNSDYFFISNDSSLDITNGGSFISGIEISSYGSGSLSISSGGSLTSAGADLAYVTIDGIGSNWTNNSGYPMIVDVLHVTGGASVTSATNFQVNGSITIDGIDSTVSGVIGMLNGTVLSISNGGAISSNGLSSAGLMVVSDGGTVTSTTAVMESVLIDGIGSTWVNNDAINTDSLTISNGGSVTSFDTTVAGNVNMSGTSLANEDVNLDIAGSLSVGGLLDIGEYANVTVADTTTLDSIYIHGGNLVTGQLNGSLAGSLFDAGSLIVINAGPAVDIGGATLGNASGGSFSMVLPQDTLINDGANLTLHNNSSLTTDILINEGRVSGYGSVNGLVNGGVNSVFAASGGSLTLGDANSFNGFRTLGLIDVGADVVTLNSQQFAQLGYQTTLNGGTLNAQNGVFLSGGNAIVGSGNVNTSIAAQTGSTISASGNLALGDIDKFDGFYSQGNLQTNEHIVTINDRNEAVLGSLSTLGNLTGAGTLQSSNGLLLQQGNNLIGYGTVNGDFINQGHVEETSVQPADFIEFTGNVSGAGDYAGSIVFSGTFTPGNSPALVSFEDIAFGLDSVLTMEIGGLFAGSQYDVLEGLTGSSATLAGTLNIDLYDLGGGLFAPSLGDSFDILTAEVLTGKFDLLTLAVLGGGLDWQLDYLFDEIGTIDIVRLSVVSASTVPVPPAVWLFASGLLGLVAVARRKKLA